MAMVVSWLATRQRGVRVKLESLTLSGATHVLVTLSDGLSLVKDVHCRRVKIGWISVNRSEVDRSPSSDGGSDVEEEVPAGSGLHKILFSMSRLRVHIKLVGVRARLRTRSVAHDGGSGDSGAVAASPSSSGARAEHPRTGTDSVKKSDWNANFFMKRILPFVSVDVHDFEVSTYTADRTSSVLLKGKRVGINMQRSEQVVVVEHVFVCPGARDVQGGRVHQQCGLIELDSASLTSALSLHDLLGSLRPARRKRAHNMTHSVSFDVNSLRVNLDKSYLQMIQATFAPRWRLSKVAASAGVFKRGIDPDPQTSASRGAVTSLRALFREGALPISFRTALSSATIHIPHSGCFHEVNLKNVSSSWDISPCRGDVREGLLESSLSWDNVSVAVGANDAVAVQCQSSRAESSLRVHIPSEYSIGNSQAVQREGCDILSIDGGIDVGALHTKVHHEHIHTWLEALQVSRRGSRGKSQTKREPSGTTPQTSIDCNVKLSIGNGSSLQFVDYDGVCMLHQSLDSAFLNLKKTGEISEAKFNVSGIAMAEETQDSRIDCHAPGGIQRLSQVLSNQSFSGSIALDEYGDVACLTSISSMSGKVSNKLMENVCLIAQSVMDATHAKPNLSFDGSAEADEAVEVDEVGEINEKRVPGSSVSDETVSGLDKRRTSTNARRQYSVRVDLLGVDLALLSSYVVEKHQSSINMRKEMKSALAVRIKNLGASRTVAGLCKVNSETVEVSYYEGVREEDFSLDFDSMEGSVHSKPLVLQGFRLDDVVSRLDADSEECERRVTVAPVEAYVDADALVSVIHFSKMLGKLTSKDFEPSPPEAALASCPPCGLKTIVVAKEVSVRAPVSSDREISIRLINGALEHGDDLTAVRLTDAAVLIKGVETLVTKGVRVSVATNTSTGANKRSVSVLADEVKFLLPHDRDPGPTFKVFSMYVKACKQLIQDIRCSTGGAAGRAPAGTTGHHGRTPVSIDGSESSPLELDIRLAKGKIVFQHHPLERWFAGHGSTIRRAALVEHLWDEAYASVMSEGGNTLTPLHSGKSQNEKDHPVKNRGSSVAQPKSWRNLMSRHASSHIRQLSTRDKSLALYEELFEVDIDDMSLHAVLETAPGAALAFVHSVDEPSRSVIIKSSVLFDVSLSSSVVEVKFGGCNRPLYSGTGVVVEGKLAFAKQATAAPEMCSRVLHIGMHHVKEIDVPLRGTCAPLKVYTDILMQTEKSSVFFSPGLEPVLGLMGVTSKRFVPSDPDSMSKRPPPVPWWDDIRYFWRGVARVTSRELSVALLPGISPTYSCLSERLEIEAGNVEVTLQPGQIALNTGVLRMLAFRKTLEENGQLCVFPVADVKSMVANISILWKLPSGIDPNNHYVFPADLPEIQSPVFVADVYKACALDVDIDVSFRRTAEDLDPPMLYIGGEIVSFWRKFVRDWEIPAFIKSQVRRGTFFVRKPKLAGKKKGLPKLLKGLKVRIDSEELHLTHFTLDGKDPGGGLLLSTTLGRWEFAWDCNKEIKSFLSMPPNSKISVDLPQEHRKKTVMSQLAVSMEHVTVKSLQFSADGDPITPGNIFRQGFADSTITSISSDSPTAAEYDDAVSESRWIAEKVEIVRVLSEEGSRFGEPCMKPLKVTVKDCYFMTDLELRDAIWATVEHLIAAFAPSEKDASIGPLRSAPTGMPSHRSYSRQSDVSDDEGDNDLLNLLLRQRNAEGTSSLASPQATDLDRHESVHAEADIMPMTSSHDDSSSELKYEVEVSNLQLILQRDHEMGTSRGRLLLATKSATLRGATTDAHTITMLEMEDVQAYISLSLIDPSAEVVWLDIDHDAKDFIAPSVEDRESVWRRVFNPINMNLRHSKFLPYALTRYSNQQQVSALARQGEELVLKIPEIAAVMDGREFEVLIDVVSFLITSGPTVHTCNSVRNLRRGFLDNSKVANDQMLLQMSSRQLGCIRGEAADLLLGMRDSRASEIWSISEPLPFSGALTMSLDAPDKSVHQPSDELREYIEQGEDALHNATLLLQWSQEQESLALEEYNLTKNRLEETSESLKRQMQVKTASRVLIHLNRVVWQLCDQERVPFVQASIKKVVFDRRRNRDRSGSVRFTIHRLDVLDATGILPEGPATSAGVILTNWNPDSSYEREPMLRVISTLGIPTSKYDVFEHLDATLHPLTLHLTEQIATASWEYFFPKEDQKSRQEAFSSSISSKKFGPAVQPSPRKSSFTASDNLSEVSTPLGKQESDVSSRSEALGVTRLPSPSMKRRDSPVIKRKKSALRLQKRFKYVKLNRAHMRITYAGKPIGIKDRVLVINSYACENLDGTWRDLLSNVKQKAIFSALFSGLGLQGRKVKELMIGAAPSIKSVELPSSEEEDLANNRGLLAKFGLKQGSHQAGTSQRRKDDPETQKKRALFGESIMHRLHRRATNNAPSPRSDEKGMPSSPPAANPYSIPRKHAVPLLELTKPLPKVDSSDSDGSIDGDSELGAGDYTDNRINELDEGPVMPLNDGPGPLGAGLTGTGSTRSSVDKAPTHPVAFDSTSKALPNTAMTGTRSEKKEPPSDNLPAKKKYDPHAPPTWSTSQTPSRRQAGPMESGKRKFP